MMPVTFDDDRLLLVFGDVRGMQPPPPKELLLVLDGDDSPQFRQTFLKEMRRVLDGDPQETRRVLDWAREVLYDDVVQDRLVLDWIHRALNNQCGKIRDELRPTRPDDQKELRGEAQPEQAVFLSKQEVQRDEPLPPPPLDRLRHLLQTLFPVLYAQVLADTFADLRQEHSALAEGHPVKARLAVLQGCSALAAAAVRQFGFTLLGRIVALWQARSSK